jgi:hypothetical protein
MSDVIRLLLWLALAFGGLTVLVGLAAWVLAYYSRYDR